jgi:hypothetical protein
MKNSRIDKFLIIEDSVQNISASLALLQTWSSKSKAVKPTSIPHRKLIPWQYPTSGSIKE